MVLEELKQLKEGDYVHVDGSCDAWRVVSNPNIHVVEQQEQVHVPIRYGEGQWSISNATMHRFHRPTGDARQFCEVYEAPKG